MLTGVRNHQAKKIMQGMKIGDQAFFYHSNAKPSGIVGIMEVVNLAHPDPTQFDPKSDYYDKTAKKENPRWFCVDVKLVKKFNRCISLEELKSHAEGPLKDMALLKLKRLSVQPVTKQEWDFIVALEGE